MTLSPLAIRYSAAAIAIALGLLGQMVRAEDPVDYARDVRPLLASRCGKCHGPDEQKSGLRLDTVALAIEGGYSGPALVAGKSRESLLIKAVTGADDTKVMPPEGERLTSAEVALLARWIDAGAPAGKEDEVAQPSARRKSDHWSFQPVRRPEVPAVGVAASAPTFLRNPIDGFIADRLAREGLAPSPEADRTTLIRRLSLDLLGITPSLAEVDEFLADTRPDAYEQLVDRLLASPHYGERQARHWLDLARYADSNGYTNDNPRSIWKYRDWVIQALNRDMPFDQFTIEQFAGDMLPGATMDQIVATGFHRNTMQNEEGGTDPEEYRIESVVDRVATTGSVFLGLSLGCARCHDHKYDPVSQRDFYQFFALLNGADEPIYLVPSEEQAKRQQELAAEISATEQTLAAHTAATATERAAWEQRLAAALNFQWAPLVPEEITAASGVPITRLDDGSLLAGGDRPKVETYSIVARAPIATITGFRIEALTDERLPGGGPGRADNGNFVLSEVKVAVAPAQTGATSAEASAPREVAWLTALADYSQEKFPVEHLIDGMTKTGWAVNDVQKNQNTNHTATLLAKGDEAVEGCTLHVTLDQQHTAPSYILGRFRLSVTSAPREVLHLPESFRAALLVPAAQRTPAQTAAILDEYGKTDPRRQELTKQIAGLKAKLAKVEQALPKTLVMREREKPRETYLLIRGEYLRNGPRVTADVPSVLPALPESTLPHTRLDLARWIVDPAHPLTWRVAVNRMWQQFFGRGLVETSNDFGLQGAPPSHPELLDWLASEFVAQHGSMKALHRLIVTSGTYRQSSVARAESLATDPENRLLSRQSRLRVEAEVMRDLMLSASGLLSHQIGGPSVYPPQPDGVMALTRSPREWRVSKGENRYRRGMYTYFWRSTPHPFLKVLDAPDGNTTCTRRDRANTPLQALTLLNDEAAVEAARALAARVLIETPTGTTGDRLRRTFRLALAREPNDAERACLAELLADELLEAPATAEAKAPEKDDENKDRDKEIVLPPNARELDQRTLGAWTTLARAVLNLDEFMTRE